MPSSRSSIVASRPCSGATGRLCASMRAAAVPGCPGGSQACARSGSGPSSDGRDGRRALVFVVVPHRFAAPAKLANRAARETGAPDLIFMRREGLPERRTVRAGRKNPSQQMLRLSSVGEQIESILALTNRWRETTEEFSQRAAIETKKPSAQSSSAAPATMTESAPADSRRQRSPRTRPRTRRTRARPRQGRQGQGRQGPRPRREAAAAPTRPQMTRRAPVRRRRPGRDGRAR